MRVRSRSIGQISWETQVPGQAEIQESLVDFGNSRLPAIHQPIAGERWLRNCASHGHNRRCGGCAR